MMDHFLNDTWNLIVHTGKSIDQVGTVPVFAAITGIAAIIGFIVKRIFVNMDFDNQQKSQHSSWLLKRTVSYAEKHYTQLARCIINLRQEFDRAKKTKDLKVIQYAYSSTVKFVDQYLKFEKETGANFLFIERIEENSAISHFQALFFALPFDRNDVEIMYNSFTSRQFQSFQDWILSTNCDNSKKIVSKNLLDLQKLLDRQSEKILHYEEFLRTIKKIKATRNWKKFTGWVSSLGKFFKNNDPEVFYILGISPKYVTPGSNVVVFGKGFIDKVEEERRVTEAKKAGKQVEEKPKKADDNVDSYELFMNNISLEKCVLDNNSVKITIPQKTLTGAYDITAKFKYKNKPGDEPMGIVIHIIP